MRRLGERTHGGETGRGSCAARRRQGVLPRPVPRSISLRWRSASAGRYGGRTARPISTGGWRRTPAMPNGSMNRTTPHDGRRTPRATRRRVRQAGPWRRPRLLRPAAAGHAYRRRRRGGADRLLSGAAPRGQAGARPDVELGQPPAVRPDLRRRGRPRHERRGARRQSAAGSLVRAGPQPRRHAAARRRDRSMPRSAASARSISSSPSRCSPRCAGC